MAFDYDAAHKKLVADLEDQAWGIATVYLQYDPEQLAHWILKEYRPPVEWEEEPSELGSKLVTFRTAVAGAIFEGTARITGEMSKRESRHIPEIKKRLRWSVGCKLMDFLAAPGEEEGERRGDLCNRGGDGSHSDDDPRRRYEY